MKFHIRVEHETDISPRHELAQRLAPAGGAPQSGQSAPARPESACPAQ